VGSTTFLLEGMTSDDCLRAVHRAVVGFDGLRIVTADLIRGLVTVTTDHPVDRSNIAAAMTAAGFTVLA